MGEPFRSITGEIIKPFKYQQKVMKKIPKNGDCLLTGPTGSGKTIFAYHFAGLLDRDEFDRSYNKVIICSPIKALSNERYLELKKAGFDVGLETGDRKINDSARILCVTQEIYLLKYCFVKNCKIIIDEIHYMFTDHQRTKAYIDSIVKTSKSSHIMLLSATIKDSKEFVEFLNKLTGRNFVHISWNERPVPLTYNDKGIDCKSVKDAIVFGFSKQELNDLCALIVKKRKEKSLKDKKKLEKLADKWRCNIQKEWNFGVSIYHGGLLPKEKFFIEEAFRSELIDVVVGTDALALGVNLPAKTVVFSTLKKKSDEGKFISSSLFNQLAGRAGRYGYHDEGVVTYLRCNGQIDKKTFKHFISKPLEDTEVLPELSVVEFLSGRPVAEMIAELESYCFSQNEDKKKHHIFLETKKTIAWQKQLSEFLLDYRGKEVFSDLFRKFYVQELSFEENLEIFLTLTEVYHDRANTSVESELELLFETDSLFTKYCYGDGHSIRLLLLMLRLFRNIEEDEKYKDFPVGESGIFKSYIEDLDHTVLSDLD